MSSLPKDCDMEGELNLPITALLIAQVCLPRLCVATDPRMCPKKWPPGEMGKSRNSASEKGRPDPLQALNGHYQQFGNNLSRKSPALVESAIAVAWTPPLKW
jgi:hypothetical protein